MSNIRSKPFQWRRDVQNWLASVLQYQRQFGQDIRRAALHEGQSFPTSALIEFVGRTVEKRLAVWAVKKALRQAATALSIQLNEDTINFLANVAVDAILASA